MIILGIDDFIKKNSRTPYRYAEPGWWFLYNRELYIKTINSAICINDGKFRETEPVKIRLLTPDNVGILINNKSGIIWKLRPSLLDDIEYGTIVIPRTNDSLAIYARNNQFYSLETGSVIEIEEGFPCKIGMLSITV